MTCGLKSAGYGSARVSEFWIGFGDVVTILAILAAVLVGLSFGYFGLGAIVRTSAIATVLAEAHYARTTTIWIFVVGLVFWVPQLFATYLSEPGSTALGRATARLALWALFCTMLFGGVRWRKIRYRNRRETV